MEVSRLPAMHCSIVDVFAERPLAGNQLAVVRNCAELDTATMQAITREMNFSETTFVVDEWPGEARVRIFTPDRELPFAGHPTLGTAWVLGRGRDLPNPPSRCRTGSCYLRGRRHCLDEASCR